MMAEPVSPSAGEPSPPLKKKRGRKRKVGTVVIHLRVNVHDYDAYCAVANRAGISVIDAMRYVLHIHAPSTPLQ